MRRGLAFAVSAAFAWAAVAAPAFAGAHDLTPSSGITYSASSPKLGSADLTGVSAGTSSLSLGSGFSVGIIAPTAWAMEAWIRVSQQSYTQIALELDSSDFIGIAPAANYAAATVGGVAINTTKTVTDGVWHHLALSCGASTCTFYVDGVAAGSAATPASLPSPNVVVGNYDTLTHTIVGDVDEAVFWSSNKYAAAFTPPSAAYAGTEGMTALYHLDTSGVDSAVVNPSTAYSITPPSRPFGVINSASGAFTISTNGSNFSNFTVAPTDENGCTSCFTPQPVPLGASTGTTSTATFTYTPTVAGAHTITTTNTAGLTAAPGVGYVAQTPANPLKSSANPLTAGGTIAYATGASGFGQTLNAASSGYGVTSAIVPYGTASIEGRVSRSAAPSSAKVAFGELNIAWVGAATTGYAQGACGGNPVISTTKSITDGAVHAIRMDMSASGCTIYVDGVSAGTSATAYNPSAAATGFGVAEYGGNVGVGYAWGGTVDEVAVWSVTKGATVTSSPYTGAEAGLVALYHLDGNLNDSATAEITSFAQVSDYTPTGGPTPASNAPGAAQAGGWYDVHGGKWSITGANQLSPVLVSQAFNVAELARPAAEKTVDAQLQIKFTQSSVTSTNVTQTYAYFRWSNAGTAATGYIANCGGASATTGILGLYKNLSGSVTALGPTIAFTPMPGTAYVCRSSAVQVNAASTRLNVSVYATDGTLLATTGNMFDNTSALQNLAGLTAIYENNTASTAGPNLVSQLTTYGDVATAATNFAFSASQTTGPATVPSTTFDLAPNGVVSSSVTVTLSDGAGGTFSPASPTLSGTASTLVTYIPATVATQTLTASASGLTSPPSISYVATVPPVNISVNSSACHFSPYNWSGDAGRGGSIYRRTFNAGAYFTCVWTADSSPTASVLVLNNSASGAVVSYVLNNVLNDGAGAGIGAQSNIPITGIIPNATNTLTVYLRSLGSNAQWNGAGNQLQVQGFQIDGSGSTPGVAPVPTKFALLPGDSTTVGFRADAGVDNNLHDFSFAIGQQLLSMGYDYGVSGVSGEGWIYLGDNGDVPAYFSCSAAPCTGSNYSEANSRWDKVDAGVSLLDSASQISAYGGLGTAPSLIYVNLLINDPVHGISASLTQAAITAWLAQVRPAAPFAKIVMLVPPALYSTSNQASNGPAFIAALKAAVGASGDPNVFIEDDSFAFGQLIYNSASGLPSSYVWTDLTHPLALGHALIASRAVAKVQSVLSPATAPQFRRTFH